MEKLKEHYCLSTDVVEKIKKEKNTKIDINKYVDKDNLFKWPTVTSNKSNALFEMKSE